MKGLSLSAAPGNKMANKVEGQILGAIRDNELIGEGDTFEGLVFPFHSE